MDHGDLVISRMDRLLRNLKRIAYRGEKSTWGEEGFERTIW
jgi:hypothetical protein